MSWWDGAPLAQQPERQTEQQDNWWAEAPLARAPRQTAALTTPKAEEPLSPLGAGWKGLGADARSAVAAVAQHVFNAPETAQELIGEADKTREEIARRYKPKVPSYRDIRTEEGILPFLSDTGQYLYEGAAQSVPQMAATAAGAGLAAVAAPAAPIAAAIAGGTAAALPFFVGQNIEEQRKDGRTLPETELGTAAVAGVVQGALDTLVGRVMPGVGKAGAGGTLVRAIKKALEGGAIEGLTEGAQQAIQIGQASPTKLFDFSPEVQHELANAAILGMGLGGTLGGGAGALSRGTSAKAPNLPVQEETASGGMGPPPPDPWRPEGTGAPVNLQEEPPPPAWQADTTAMFPEGDTAMTPYGPPNPPGWEPERTGLPRDQQSQPPFEPDTSVLFPAPGFFRTGQQVYKDVQQKLLAAGQKPMEANANAAILRARYETLGKQIGTDAWTAYQQQNLDIKGPGGTTPEGGQSYNQDPTIDPQHYSLAQSVLNRVPMKQGNSQQWLNILKKNGVKDEELEWTGFNDWLKEQDGSITKDQAIANFRPYGLAVFEAQPGAQGKQSYAEWTLGGYGKDPTSNYREVIVSDDSQPPGTYESPHWPKVPNPLGHYRTTDRTTSAGAPVLLAEEFQSDWNQAGRERGYAKPNDLDKANDAVDAAAQRLTREGETMAALTAYNNAVVSRDKIAVQVPSAPFQQSWPNLLFRHALMDAIKQGKDYLAWNTAENMPDIEGWGSKADPKKVEAMRQFYDKRMVDYANKLLKPYGGQVENLRVQSASVSSEDAKILGELGYQGKEGPIYRAVHAVPITDQMRELIGTGGLPLFQRKQGTPQGNITITPEQATIRLFKTANASTFQHEAGHLFLEELGRYAPQNKDIASDLTTFRKWLGREEGDATPLNTKEHERFARGWEQYLRTGQAPTKGLQGIFEQFKQWLMKIYRTAMDLDVTVPKHIQEAYGRLISRHDEVGKAKSSKLPQGVMYNAPEQTFTGAPPPTGGSRTFSQSPVENTESIYNRSKATGSALWRKTKGFVDPFSEINNPEAYRDARNLMMGGVGAASRAATDARAIFDGLSNQEKDKAFEFFKTPSADATLLPEAIRAKAVALKRYINTTLRDELVKNNLLSPEAGAKQEDAYLPRLYLQHLVEGGGLANSFRLNRSYAKKKQDKTTEELIARGEVKDPGIASYHAVFRTMRDLAAMDFMKKIAENPEWSFRPGLTEWNGQKVTPDWLKREADHIVEKRAPAEANPERKQAMLDVAQRMRDQATTALIALDKADYDPKEWSKLPDTSDFGPLRGMIVQRQIAEDLKGTQNFVNPDNTWAKWFGDSGSMLAKGTAHWKALKVPMNPPSIVRNVVSNFVLANILGGVRIDRVAPVFIQAARELRNDGPYYRIAKKYGIGQSTFSEQELRAIHDELQGLDSKDSYGFLGLRKVLNGFLRLEKFAGDKYQKMEEWGKLAILIDGMKNQGLKENEAARLANKALFDYSETHPFVKGARQSPIGMPFMTFPYKAIPALIETAAKHPTRFLPYVAMAFTIPSIVAATNDIDEDDAEKLRKSLSTNLRRRKDMYLLPFKDAEGRWQFADIGYFMPWQMPADIGRSLGEAGIAAVQGRGREATSGLADAFKSSSLLSNPLFNVVSAMTTGIDPFTSRPIADKRDPATKQVMDIASYLWSMAVPSLFSGYGALGMLKDKEVGTGLNRYGEPSPTYGQIAGRAMGLNTYPVMPEEQRARNISYMKRDIQDVRSRMTSALKDQSLTMEQRRRIAADYMDTIKDRVEEMQRYVRESEPSPRLRSATANQ